MTRRGAHRGGFSWGGGGIDIGRQRYTEIMGALDACESDLKKLGTLLSHWPHGPDVGAVREALDIATRLHQGAQYYGRQAQKFQLVKASRVAPKLIAKASLLRKRLISILEHTP